MDIPFTVDSALLRELGARLVGQPHIALAELIKNSYDADARHVRLTFTDDELIVEDDGHGMSFDDFVHRWMRIGTTHKKDGQTSPELGRVLTGSKGVGRLATQLLSRRMHVESVGLLEPTTKGFDKRTSVDDDELAFQVEADVNWGLVDDGSELTEITVPVDETSRRSTFVDGSKCGTRLILRDLIAEWDAESFRALAQEIWVLQPPFAVPVDEAEAFQVTLVSPYGDVMEEFGRQMEAILENWQAFITLELLDDDPDVTPTFEFDPLAVPDFAIDEDDIDEDEDDDEDDDDEDHDEDHDETEDLPAAKLLKVDINLGRGRRTSRTVRIPNCLIDQLHADIRVFNLSNRQANNVLVADARRYMSMFGGVHLYDSEFRLPYYGPQDWLDIERDAARRLSQSQLLPKNLKTARAMQDLPARRRLFGVAEISTAHEARVARRRHVPENQALSIQSSRDRLVTNKSLKTLKGVVRLALDLYATDTHRAKSTAGAGATNPVPDPTDDIQRALSVLETVKDKLDEAEYEALNDNMTEARSNSAGLVSRTKAQSSLLGSLATIGMTTLAWEHEATKQRLLVYSAAERLERAADEARAAQMRETARVEARALKDSAVRLDEIAHLFRPVLSTESRETVTQFRARRLIAQLVRQLKPLARGAETDFEDVPKNLKLPPGTHAGWTALLQNLLLNSYAAVLDTEEKNVAIDTYVERGRTYLRIEDTGTGVDLTEAETYFEPFVRANESSETQTRLGLGGTGLGLTIVRVVANDLGVRVRFVEPTEHFKTSVVIDWEA